MTKNGLTIPASLVGTRLVHARYLVLCLQAEFLETLRCLKITKHLENDTPLKGMSRQFQKEMDMRWLNALIGNHYVPPVHTVVHVVETIQKRLQSLPDPAGPH